MLLTFLVDLDDCNKYFNVLKLFKYINICELHTLTFL